MDKEQKILDQFCKKVAEKGMSIFAQDAAPSEKPEWITMNGTHIHVGEGETPKEAGEKFAAKKETERGPSKASTPSENTKKEKTPSNASLQKSIAKANAKLNKTLEVIKRIRAQLSNENITLGRHMDLTEKLKEAYKKNDEAFKEFEALNQKEKARATEQQKSTSATALPPKTSLKDLEVKLSKKSVPLSKKDQAVHNSMMDLIHEQHQYEINRRDYLDAQKTMKQLENTYRGKFTPEYQKAKQKADAALTKYSFALHKFRDLQSKMKTEHGIELTDKL